MYWSNIFGKAAAYLLRRSLWTFNNYYTIQRTTFLSQPSTIERSNSYSLRYVVQEEVGRELIEPYKIKRDFTLFASIG